MGPMGPHQAALRAEHGLRAGGGGVDLVGTRNPRTALRSPTRPPSKAQLLV